MMYHIHLYQKASDRFRVTAAGSSHTPRLPSRIVLSGSLSFFLSHVFLYSSQNLFCADASKNCFKNTKNRKKCQVTEPRVF